MGRMVVSMVDYVVVEERWLSIDHSRLILSILRFWILRFPFGVKS